ncbi:MAG: hypothetical protein ABIG61_06450 [Planctomycetota bacterium]
MKLKKVLFYLLAALLGGCVLSIHPLYTANVLVFEEKLLGVWIGDDSRWEFKIGKDENPYAAFGGGKRQDGKRFYSLTIDQDEKQTKRGEFVAHLVKLDDTLFLDLFPAEPNLASDFYKFHLLPVHSFIKVEQIDPTLKMRMSDSSKFEKMLAKDPNIIDFEAASERIVLTAEPNELQEFLRKHANNENFFGDPFELKRFEPAEPNKPVDADPNGSSKEIPAQ